MKFRIFSTQSEDTIISSFCKKTQFKKKAIWPKSNPITCDENREKQPSKDETKNILDTKKGNF